jgi:AmmeMemoRadiSam system protein B
MRSKCSCRSCRRCSAPSPWCRSRSARPARPRSSHYHADAEARRLDAATAARIEAFEAARLGPEDACGYRAVAGLLVEAAARGLAIERLDLRNSGETAGHMREVVGYGAWALSAA